MIRGTVCLVASRRAFALAAPCYDDAYMRQRRTVEPYSTAVTEVNLAQ